MALTIVRVTSGGIPVTETAGGMPYYEADNGFGIPVTFVAQGGAPLGRATGGGGAANTLQAGVGSFILSGEAMSPIADYRITAAVGALTLTGQAATLSTTSTGQRQFAIIQSYLNSGASRSFAAFDQYVN